MFWDHQNIKLIHKYIVKKYDDVHSGASFACSMRNAEFIAKKGFNKWNRKVRKETYIGENLLDYLISFFER